MNRREHWRKVVDLEVQRWSMVPYGQLVSAVRDQQVYEIEFDSKKYQVEIEILDETAQYVHIIVSLDDGSLPASILPATRSFIQNKPPSGF
jgi:hypothetical protein